MPLKQNWTDRDTVTATFLNQLASAVNSAVASLAGKYTKPAGGIPASDLAGNVLDKTTADTIYVRLEDYEPGGGGSGSLTDDGTGLFTFSGGTLLTEDGSTGLFTIGA